VAPPAPEATKPEVPKIEAPVRIETAAPAPVAVSRGSDTVVEHKAEISPAEARVAFLQTKVAAQQVAFVAAPEAALVKDLEELKETVTAPQKSVKVVAESAVVTSAGVSLIYLLWTIRGGYLLASLLSSMPAWKLVDPLPILDHFDNEGEQRRKRRDGETDDESLESLAEGGQAARSLT
jgi:hypothetical protein